MRRKESLVTGQVYHIFNRSIADFTIFNNDDEFLRMQQLMQYYQIENELRFSDFIELEKVQAEGFNNFFNFISKDKERLVRILAYCLMPTHFHLILRQLEDRGISLYLRDIQNSYSHYFNTKHKRKGPLWESKFKNVLVENNEQLLHLTRYIHLNPVTAYLVKRPEQWYRSSYNEYLSVDKTADNLCKFDDILEIKPKVYRKFVNDQISYQRELIKIKKLIID